ncbi:hypothetical protein AB0N16_24845 [Streptomyces sp. NPDC051105]|uniref:hypothetical protein n=1 Tax=Streptomyces sp. NPDC051105 TaxID=3154843 RepID=UPI00343950FE
MRCGWSRRHAVGALLAVPVAGTQLGRTYQFRHAALGNRLAQRLPELRNSAPTDL